MFEDLLYESTSRKVLSHAVNSVIFMAQRPNIAMSMMRAKFTGILSDSVGGTFTGMFLNFIRFR